MWPRIQKQVDRGKMVQLGGIEPPTSGSTIRRSNQLSYNCILDGRDQKPAPGAPFKGGPMRGKLGATPRFGKTAVGRQKARTDGPG